MVHGESYKFSEKSLEDEPHAVYGIETSRCPA